MFERIESMKKRQDVEDAFKVSTQAHFDVLFGGQVSESTQEQQTGAIVDELTNTNESIDLAELQRRFGIGD